MKQILIALAFIVLLQGLTFSTESHASQAYSNQVTIIFDWAAKEDVPLNNSLFTVAWNKKQLKEITPIDYHVHTFEMDVEAHVGENILDFTGSGYGSSKNGVGIANVQLVRNARTENSNDVIVNGELETSDDLAAKIYPNSIPGWKGKIKVINGRENNKFWRKCDNVAVLANNGEKFDFFQLINFDHDYQPVTSLEENGDLSKPFSKKLTILFDWAAKQGVPLKNSAFALTWNGVVLKELVAKDYDVHTFRQVVDGKKGENVLSFNGNGDKGDYSVSVTNIVINRNDGTAKSTDLAENGAFEAKLGGDRKNFAKGIKGWNGEITVAEGFSSNKNWGKGLNVADLSDGKKNLDIYQSLYLDSFFYKVVPAAAAL